MQVWVKQSPVEAFMEASTVRPDFVLAAPRRPRPERRSRPAASPAGAPDADRPLPPDLPPRNSRLPRRARTRTLTRLVATRRDRHLPRRDRCFWNRTAVSRRRVALPGSTSDSRRSLAADSASASGRVRHSRPGRRRADRTGHRQRLPNASLSYGGSTHSNGSAIQTARTCQIRKAFLCSRSFDCASPRR